MAPSKLKKAIGAVKDRTSISLAKVGNKNSLSDLEVAILKATRHEEYPAEDKHIREILSLTSYSRAYIGACVSIISKRLNKTKNWTVALKTLMLIQRLLADGDPAYEQEIFFSTRRGTRLLNMSDFRDTSRSNSWDFSAFVRTYALYLDELLEFRMQGRRGKRSMFGIDEDEEEVGSSYAKSTPVRDMKSDSIFSRIQHLQQVLERFLACRPTGSAKSNRVVIVALYPVVKESFHIYYDITEILGILIDRFMELEINDSVKVYEIFCRISKQYDELDLFYGWCKTVGIARSSEYPEVEKITPKKLELMDEFIRDKSALAQNKKPMTEKEAETTTEEKENMDTIKAENMDTIKALPSPESFYCEFPDETEEPKEKEKQIIKEEKNKAQLEGDLLNLANDSVTTEEHGDKLALALFDGNAPFGPAPPPGWEAFHEDTADWETALVQSASNLSHQQASLGGDFDMLLLDGMYQQGTTAAAMVASPATGSSSSVALGSIGRPAMLALPATPSTTQGTQSNADPFEASDAVAPPPYVQMSDLEKKQKLLVEEQLMWQQYARDGMQGQLGMAKLQPNSWNMGGYTPG
ncbi:putative clathrin assembly protein At4g02650 [Pistacia vera]|uniref:putative clathrin assembly protein At4g02650 n=1 Tax=Pistacia vera TaxID=55513 RepID=UPI001262C1B5|nr:putative clathrin assembly protein At4g02650 [Pistacia vera]